MIRRGGKRRRERTRRKPGIEKHLDRSLVLKFALVLLFAILLTTLFPRQQSYEYSTFRLGTIATSEVIAPETFYVQKTEAEFQAELSSARQEVLPVLVRDHALPSRQVLALESLFADLKTLRATAPSDSLIQSIRRRHPTSGPLSESTMRFLLLQVRQRPGDLADIETTARDLLQSGFQSGILETHPELEAYSEAQLSDKGRRERVSLARFHDIDAFSTRLQSDLQARRPNAHPDEVKAIYELVLAFLLPNIVYDHEATNALRDEAVSTISRIKGTVLKGERIVDEHDRIGANHIDKLNSLSAHMNRHGNDDPFVAVAQVGARAVITMLILAIFYGFLSLSRPALFRRFSNLILFAILILMPAVVAHYAAAIDTLSPFLVPIALSAMLATVLFDAEIGLVISLVNATLCASMLGELQYGLIYLITGIIGAYSVREVRHRSDFYRSIVYLVAAYVLTLAATSLLLFTYPSTEAFWGKIRQDLVIGVFAAGASSVLTIGLLPIFESIFDVVTPITLLELSDLNRPLLRGLAIRAPGTYSHSMNMANLSEAAADAIGADRLMVRVGCYYHDIGKMIRPQYFIENQKGINPHDELQPKMSALILISHVKDGVELAEEEGLPKAIIDLIPQHHGTSEIASFKHRALEQGDRQSVRDEDFRYPGPKPQTKEAGIINVADAVESATRTLSGNDPDQIRSMVQTIVKGRFTAGELDECDLTLRDLNNIQDAFMPVLLASRHHRVPYPWQVRQQQQQSRQTANRNRS